MGNPVEIALVGGFALQRKPSVGGSYPAYLPYDSNRGVAWGVVLHQESGGGAVPGVHRREAREAGQLVVGLRPYGEA